MAADYTVISVNQSEDVDAAGNLLERLQIIFTVPNRPGSFTVNVELTGDVVQDAANTLSALASQVQAIYAL